jgi:hypothetical protein
MNKAIEELSFSYQPVAPKNSIYHRSGWREVMDHLERLHRDGARVRMIDLVDNYYFNPKNGFINCHWIGIIHHVPGVPTGESPYLEQLFNDKRFRRDLFYCLGIFTLSEYLRRYLERQPIFHRITIEHAFHPTQLKVPEFSLEAYRNNSEPKLVFVGNQDRRLDRFYRLNTGREKVWLSGKPVKEANELIKEKLLSENSIKYQASSKIRIARLSDSEYDELLQRNPVMVDLYNSSANNTVIECIARSTPIFVNMVGGIMEYLGKNYPLYFNDLAELEHKLEQPELIEQAHQHLQEMDKQFLTFERFLATLRKGEIAKSVVRTNAKFSGKAHPQESTHLQPVNRQNPVHRAKTTLVGKGDPSGKKTRNPLLSKRVALGL